MLSPLLYVSIINYSDEDYSAFFDFLKKRELKYSVYYDSTKNNPSNRELVISLLPEMLFIEDSKKEYLTKLNDLFNEFQHLTPVFEFVDNEGESVV